jgi:hypothetical protein
MEINKSVPENTVIINEVFNHDLDMFFMTYPPNKFKTCLINVFKGYLSSDLCTRNLPHVRESTGEMVLSFIEVLDKGQ